MTKKRGCVTLRPLRIYMPFVFGFPLSCPRLPKYIHLIKNGAHWQSDVDAGMLAASVLHAKLHSSPAFSEQMNKAKMEFLAKKGTPAHISSATHSASSADNHLYNLAGQQLSAEPSQGIFIRSGKKYIPRTGGREE